MCEILRAERLAGLRLRLSDSGEPSDSDEPSESEELLDGLGESNGSG